MEFVFTPCFGDSPPSAIPQWFKAMGGQVSVLRDWVLGVAVPMHQPPHFLEAEAKFLAFSGAEVAEGSPPQWLHIPKLTL